MPLTIVFGAAMISSVAAECRWILMPAVKVRIYFPKKIGPNADF
jgi:hypothetical protein